MTNFHVSVILETLMLLKERGQLLEQIALVGYCVYSFLIHTVFVLIIAKFEIFIKTFTLK